MIVVDKMKMMFCVRNMKQTLVIKERSWVAVRSSV